MLLLTTKLVVGYFTSLIQIFLRKRPTPVSADVSGPLGVGMNLLWIGAIINEYASVDFCIDRRWVERRNGDGFDFDLPLEFS